MIERDGRPGGPWSTRHVGGAALAAVLLRPVIAPGDSETWTSGNSVVHLVCRRRRACRRPPPPGDTSQRSREMDVRGARWSAWRIGVAALAAVLLWVALAVAGPAHADSRAVEQFLDQYLNGCVRHGGARGQDPPSRPCLVRMRRRPAQDGRQRDGPRRARPARRARRAHRPPGDLQARDAQSRTVRHARHPRCRPPGSA